MKIIVLSKTDYKEKDVIINAISEEELISFKVRNGQVPTSAFNWLNNVLTIADVEFIDNPRYNSKILKNAKLISSPLTSGNDYSHYLAIQFIVEALNKGLNEEEKHLMFKEIENFFLENKNNDDLLLSEAVFLIRLARAAGFGLNVDGCVCCGSKKDIVAFSFAEGGFICREHFNHDMIIDFTGSDLKIVRYLINVENYSDLIKDGANKSINKDDKRRFLSKFANFFEESLGSHINSLDLIVKN